MGPIKSQTRAAGNFEAELFAFGVKTCENQPFSWVQAMSSRQDQALSFLKARADPNVTASRWHKRRACGSVAWDPIFEGHHFFGSAIIYLAI